MYERKAVDSIGGYDRWFISIESQSRRDVEDDPATSPPSRGPFSSSASSSDTVRGVGGVFSSGSVAGFGAQLPMAA